MTVRAQSEKRGADQGRLLQREAGAPVLGFDPVRAPAAVLRLEVAEIVFAPRHRAAPAHDLEGVSAAVRLEADAQGGMACKQGVKGVAQAG